MGIVLSKRQSNNQFSLSSFKNQITSIARPNRFAFHYNKLKANHVFWAQKVNIPKIDIKGPSIKWRGTEYFLPGDATREYLNVTFINDSKWEVRSIIEDEAQKLRDFFENENNGKDFFDDSNVGRATIDQYNDANELIVSYIFEDVIPLEISEISLDHTQSSATETFDVTFYYSSYKRKTT